MNRTFARQITHELMAILLGLGYRPVADVRQQSHTKSDDRTLPNLGPDVSSAGVAGFGFRTTCPKMAGRNSFLNRRQPKKSYARAFWDTRARALLNRIRRQTSGHRLKRPSVRYRRLSCAAQTDLRRAATSGDRTGPELVWPRFPP